MTRFQDAYPDKRRVRPDLLDEWLVQSRNGDMISRNRMLIWVHHTALDYYSSKVSVEPLMSTADAWDMASDSVIEFERSWKRVRRVAHYCRRMFKNNLNRFLNRKRRLLLREQELDLDFIERACIASVSTLPKFDFERLSDDECYQVATARAELEKADESVKKIFEYRVFSGRLTYAEIGELIGASETSLRMRMTRFNRRVKIRHEQLVWLRGNGERRPPVSRLGARGLK